MRANGYEEWLSRNVKKGGERPSYDPYNKAKKGSERNPSAKEYANKDVEEYHHYNERRNTAKDDEDRKQNDSAQSGNTQKAERSKSGRPSSQLARNIITRVVAVVAGAVITVSGYQAIKTNNETVVKTTWNWSEDYETATVSLYNVRGILIKEVPATVNVTKTEATCTKEGLLNYSAFAEYKDVSYSDEKNTIISAIGHSYGDAVITTVDGVPTIILECEHCHEKITIGISPSED